MLQFARTFCAKKAAVAVTLQDIPCASLNLPLFLAPVSPVAIGFLHLRVHQMENFCHLQKCNFGYLVYSSTLTHNKRQDTFVLVSIQVFHLRVQSVWLWRFTDMTRDLLKGWNFVCGNTVPISGAGAKSPPALRNTQETKENLCLKTTRAII